MKAGVPGAPAICPSMKLKIVVSFPDLIAKQTPHGPAQVPRTASAAEAFRQEEPSGNVGIADSSLPESRDNVGHATTRSLAGSVTAASDAAPVERWRAA